MGRVDRLIARGRRRAEALMVDSGDVERPTGEVDELTGKPVQEHIWSGPIKVQTYEPQESNPEAGDSIWTVQRYSVHVPVGSFNAEIGDVITVTASTHDPQLSGRKFRVVALLHKSWATAYRLGVEDFGEAN